MAGNNWNKSVNFVPSKDISNFNQKINKNKFKKWMKEKNKFNNRLGESITRTEKTNKKACIKDWT